MVCIRAQWPNEFYSAFGFMNLVGTACLPLEHGIEWSSRVVMMLFGCKTESGIHNERKRQPSLLITLGQVRT